MAENAMTKPFVDYDAKNDSLFVRFAEEAEATTLQFQEWLMVRVGTRTGVILAIEVNGFKRLLDQLTRYVKRHAPKSKKPATAGADFSVAYDKASDSLWVRSSPSEPADAESLDKVITVYRGRTSGRIVAVRIPQYSHRWYPMLKESIEAFVDEVFAGGGKTPSKRRKVVADLVSQVDISRLRDLATAG